MVILDSNQSLILDVNLPPKRIAFLVVALNCISTDFVVGFDEDANFRFVVGSSPPCDDCRRRVEGTGPPETDGTACGTVGRRPQTEVADRASACFTHLHGYACPYEG